MAKHLEYFKMKIQVFPLENVDERILAGNQSAYQIDGAAGSCCWIRFGMTSWTLGDQHSAGEKRGTTGGQMGMGTGSGNGTEGKSKQGIKNLKKEMNYHDQEGNWVWIWNKSCGRQSKKLI